VPTLQERTREELRIPIGYLLGANFKELESDASGSTTTFLTDDVAIKTADDANGHWLVFTSGQSNIDGQIRQVTNTTVSSNRVTMTFYPAVSNAPVDGATAELWPQEFDPAAIHAFINQAIIDTTGQIFDPVEDLSLHTGGASRFDIPTTLEVLYGVYLRTKFSSTQIIPAGVVWDESIDSNFTVTQDTEDLLFGRTSTKFVITSSVSAGDLASDGINSLDISQDTHIEFPIKVRDAVAANDLILRLSATANGADTNKFISIPAITEDVDTWVRVAMTDNFNPSAATAIISVALEYNANHGDNIIWLGEVRSTNNDSNHWTPLPSYLWEIDKGTRDLVLTNNSEDITGYMLMKLVGGDNPALLTSDSTVTEVPESYITYRAAGLALGRPMRGESPETTRARMSQAGVYLGMAEQAKGKFPILKNARFVT